MELRLKDVAIPIPSLADPFAIEQTLDRAIADSGLTVTLRATLRKYPGCIHWHLKLGRESGTLELTFWPRERRAWFTVQSGRKAPWIEKQRKLLNDAIRRQIGAIA